MRLFKCHYILTLVLAFFVISTKGQKAINVSHLEAPVVIDGEFEEELWKESEMATGFVQMEPQRGKPASERTEVFLGIHGQQIFVVFKCFQSTPVIAKNQNRDAWSKNDDLVGVLIDSYNDSRSGYFLGTTPQGIQIDSKINDDGRNVDVNWDTEWNCAVKEFEWGWCAEFGIPFKSLKYKKGLATWGINFSRIIRSNFETVYWSGTLSDDLRVSQGGVANNIVTPKSKMKLAIFPYASLFKTSGKDWKFDGGGDIRWQISPNVSFNGTVNPDFATVEADQQQINLSRYELSYPEKRLFFQEGNEMYGTRIKTFYSRRIRDIDFGNRLNGKIGRTQFNVLNVRTPEIAEEPGTWFTAARAKLDFLKSSTLGLTFVDKSWNDGYTRSVSLDYLMNLGKTWKLTGQFVGSAPGDFWDHSAWFMRFARENNVYHYHIRYTEIGKDFRDNVNQTGFITDDDRREIDSDVTYKWWLKNNTFEYIHFQSRNNIFWSKTTGDLRSWYITDALNFYFKNKLNFEYAYNNEYKLFEKEFHNHKHRFELGYNTDEWSHAIFSYTTGDNFDRDFYLVSGGGQIKLLRNLSLSYTGNRLKFSPDNEDNSTFINVLTANYNFTNDLWLKVFAQNNSQTDNRYFYGLLGWRLKPPFGALYLIYSHDEFDETGIPDSDNFFVKLTYPISLVD